MIIFKEIGYQVDHYLEIGHHLWCQLLMGPQWYLELVLTVWLSGIMVDWLVIVLMAQLKLYGHNLIDYFYCDFSPKIVLAYSGTQVIQVTIFFSHFFSWLNPLDGSDLLFSDCGNSAENSFCSQKDQDLHMFLTPDCGVHILWNNHCLVHCTLYCTFPAPLEGHCHTLHKGHPHLQPWHLCLEELGNSASTKKASLLQTNWNVT